MTHLVIHRRIVVQQHGNNSAVISRTDAGCRPTISARSKSPLLSHFNRFLSSTSHCELTSILCAQLLTIGATAMTPIMQVRLGLAAQQLYDGDRLLKQ